MGGMIFEIELCDCWFYAKHGVFPQEITVGNEFQVDLCVKIDAGNVVDDDISTSVSYAGLYEIVKSEMAVPRRLLETVAIGIAEKIRAHFPMVKEGTVTVCKSAPPIAGCTGTAKVKLNF